MSKKLKIYQLKVLDPLKISNYLKNKFASDIINKRIK